MSLIYLEQNGLVVICRCGVDLLNFVVEHYRAVGLVVIRYFFEQSYFDRRVLHLLLNVQVHCVIVGSELISLKELNCGLIQLQNQDLVQQS